jgi:hypothetical protein
MSGDAIPFGTSFAALSSSFSTEPLGIDVSLAWWTEVHPTVQAAEGILLLRATYGTGCALAKGKALNTASLTADLPARHQP